MSFTVYLPIGWVVAFFTWGGLLWCYAAIVYATAFDVEQLPHMYFGGGFGYVISALKALYAFSISLLVVMLPYIIVSAIVRWLGIQSRLVLVPLLLLGLFAFPIAVLTVSISRDITLLARLDYFFRPIRKAFYPYFLVFVLFALTWQLQVASLNYGDIVKPSAASVFMHLAANIGIQIMAILTMRAIGLFYRHYNCFFYW